MKLLCVHTGGTIGMHKTDDGLAPADGLVEDEIANIAARGLLDASVAMHVLAPLIDSANATPKDWERMAAAVARRHDEFDGFVITHGTDTMAYSAAALCFALAGLARPVVLTGSMLPLRVYGGDAQRNLIEALRTATVVQPGVWVQFAGKLLHGARVHKSHSTSFDAFAASATSRPPRRDIGGFETQFGNARIAILPLAPGIPDIVLQTASESCDGIVLRCYGSGTAPESPGLRRALECARQRDIPVLAVSQCAEGGITLKTYAAGAILRDNDVIDGRDMTVEAACVKLHHALANRDSPSEQRHYLASSLCGEFVD